MVMFALVYDSKIYRSLPLMWLAMDWYYTTIHIKLIVKLESYTILFIQVMALLMVLEKQWTWTTKVAEIVVRRTIRC